MPALAGSVTAPANFATNPDALAPFRPDFWVLKVTVGTVDVSFDGQAVHLTLASTDAILVLPTAATRLWVRQNGGAATLRWSAMTQA